MKILAIDSSGQTASAALIQDGVIKAEYSVNNKKTHSESLLPMVDGVLTQCSLTCNDLDAVAIAKGPGSFTGLRIGSSTAKGICFANKIPMVEVSTLLGLAMNMVPTSNIIVPIMDARRSEVYTAAYNISIDENGINIDTLIEESALNIEVLAEKLNNLGKDVVFTGDGVPPYITKMKEMLKVNSQVATAGSLYQHASSVAIIAEDYAKRGLTIPASQHKPVYLRDMAQGVKYEG